MVALFLLLKIVTTGEAYMVVSSLPVPSGINHTEEIAIMSVKLLSAVISFEIGFRYTQREAETALLAFTQVNSPSLAGCELGVEGQVPQRVRVATH